MPGNELLDDVRMTRRVSQFALCFLLLSAPTFAERPALPSRGLEDRISFWKKIFTQYGENDLVIHDRTRVNLIYEVTTEDDERSRVAAIQTAFTEIEANANGAGSLSGKAQQIRELMVANGIQVTPFNARELGANVHSQRGIKERFRAGIIRSGRHVDQIRTVFGNHGVPAEIALLPLIESSFENRSRSRVGAAGLWQFTRSTGRLYGLRATKKGDDRLNPVKATTAAARLLRDNYRVLGTWPLAITAYNHGRAGMARAKQQHGDDIVNIIDNYRGRIFGYASMNFYAEFLAAVEVYENHPQYFGSLVLDRPNSPTTTVSAAKAGEAQRYRVRAGDTLARIAGRFGTTIQHLMSLNELRKTTIYVGQMLFVGQ